MPKQYSNPCILCGSERYVVKTWQEEVGNSKVTMTETVCPNKECQKKVDQENRRIREKNEAMKQRTEQRLLQRKAAKEAERQAKADSL